MDSQPSRLDVEAVVHAEASLVRSRIGRWATVEPIDGGRCRLRMSADSPDWVLLTLGSVDAEFDVVRPPEVVERARQWIDRFGRSVDRYPPVDVPGGAPPG
jgi:hypothetical protein